MISRNPKIVASWVETCGANMRHIVHARHSVETTVDIHKLTTVHHGGVILTSTNLLTSVD
jgi:hypothetical protein